MPARRRSRSRFEMVIFDFDLTLVDTRPVETLRAAKRWRSVMAQASTLVVYDGIHELIWELDAYDETLAIVTKSPDMVPRYFVKQHKWPIDIVLGYHQVKKRKPDPEALLWPCKGLVRNRAILSMSVTSLRIPRPLARLG